MNKLLVLLAIALVLVGIVAIGFSGTTAVELPTLPALPALAPTVAPTPWTGDSVPATCVACYPAPCDCWPDC